MGNDQLQRIMEARKRGAPSYRQTPKGILLLIIAIVTIGSLYFYHHSFLYYSLIGFVLGYILRRGKFCFVAGMRDPYLIGTTTLLRCIILSIMISTLGYTLFEYIRQGGTMYLEAPTYVDSVNIFTGLGGLLFGIGMVIAGGCATGMVVRIGEGYIAQILVLIGFIIGATLAGMWDGLWHFVSAYEKVVYFPTYMPLPVAVCLQEAVLLIMYILAGRYEIRRFNKNGGQENNESAHHGLFR